MKKVVRLTESDLVKLIKKVIKESDYNDYYMDQMLHPYGNPNYFPYEKSEKKNKSIDSIEFLLKHKFENDNEFRQRVEKLQDEYNSDNQRSISGEMDYNYGNTYGLDSAIKDVEDYIKNEMGMKNMDVRKYLNYLKYLR